MRQLSFSTEPGFTKSIKFAAMYTLYYRRQLFFTCLLMAGFLFSGCGSGTNEGRLPTNLIQNPHSAEKSKGRVKMPVFEFVKEFHDFGRVIHGEQVSFGFEFKNAGNAMLLISSIGSSCRCAVASFPKKPLKPGESGVISVRFDSRGRRGSQVKTITLMANTQPNTKQLIIQANVVRPNAL